MNVGELKAVLAEHDDDTPVILNGYPLRDIRAVGMQEIFHVGPWGGYLRHLTDSPRNDTFDAVVIESV